MLCLGMGEGYLFRKWFNNASKLKDQQDDWCEAAARLNASSHHHQDIRLSTPFPEDLELESLVALLRGDTKLNIHCYEPHDIEAMVRHSLEYDFEITAFHHALKAWKVPEVIKRAKGNITIATFSGRLYDFFSANSCTLFSFIAKSACHPSIHIMTYRYVGIQV